MGCAIALSQRAMQINYTELYEDESQDDQTTSTLSATINQRSTVHPNTGQYSPYSNPFTVSRAHCLVHTTLPRP